jgi:hypothetical protein
MGLQAFASEKQKRNSTDARNSSGWSGLSRRSLGGN